MMNLEGLKKGDKFWCWWMSRYLYFIRKFETAIPGLPTSCSRTLQMLSSI